MRRVKVKTQLDKKFKVNEKFEMNHIEIAETRYKYTKLQLRLQGEHVVKDTATHKGM